MDCDPDVFAHGKTVCITDISDERAEQICKDLTLKLPYHFDWFYAGGRVVIKALQDTPKRERVKRVNRIKEAVKKALGK